MLFMSVLARPLAGALRFIATLAAAAATAVLVVSALLVALLRLVMVSVLAVLAVWARGGQGLSRPAALDDIFNDLAGAPSGGPIFGSLFSVGVCRGSAGLTYGS